VLVVLLAVLASSAASAAFALRRPRLAVAIPAPLVLGGALLQPEGSELLPSAVAGILVMAGLALAYGADLPQADTGAGVTRFEARRLGRGVGLMALLVAALVAVAQAGFLFPEPDSEPVVPPRRPPPSPAEPDRVLFTIESPRPGPWRVGVLDGYDGEAFLLPALDPKAFVEVDRATGGIPGVSPARDRETETITFRIADVRGGTLPGPASPINVRATKDVELDPRAQVLRLPGGRPPEGFTYRVTSPTSADGRALADAPAPPTPIVTEFTAAPQPPNEVVTLLGNAPTTNAFDRLQFVRQALFNNITAVGAGRPTEVSPGRVGAMLRPGAEATPYEITAAEVLIARWAGIPSRIGFGFYGGEARDATGADAASAPRRQYRPKHGAAWLEAYFEGYGWVPLVGTPPKAKSSLSDEEKRDDPAVSAAQELALVVYVPVELETIELLFQRVRHWASIAIPLLALLALASVGWPVVAKTVRRNRRHHWATRHGPTARVWAAYADLRDAAFDLNIGRGAEPPLEFLAAVAPDEQHEELAWLVTRVVWGDLRRDVAEEDAVAAEELARSVRQRLSGAQPIVNRVSALVAKASLRRPYAPELPNVSWADTSGPAVRDRNTGPRRQRLPRRARILAALRRLVRPRTVIAGGLVVIALVAPLFVPVGRPASAETPSILPEILPTDALGYAFEREARLEGSYREPGEATLATGGRVFTIRKGTVVAGSFQVAVLRPDVDGRDRDVQEQIERTLQTGGFETNHYGPIRLRTLRKAEQVLWVWFPPDRNVMELFVLRADVADGPQLVREAIRQQLRLPLEEPR
jgi:hypothetical protein